MPLDELPAKLATAINSHWLHLSISDEEERIFHLTSICRSILIAETGLLGSLPVTGWKLNQLLKELKIQQAIDALGLPPEPAPEAKPKLYPPPRDPSKPLEPYEKNEGDSAPQA